MEERCRGSQGGTEVTDADRIAEQLLRNRIAERYPDHAILGEEFGGDKKRDAEHLWLLDPVDGTASFAIGLPMFGTLIGYLRRGQPCVGVIAAHALGEMTSGEISLPLLESVEVAGLTPRQLETALERLLCQKYIKDPHVSVFVHEMQSHPVSVMGAIRKPGVFQIRGAKPLLEVLSMAEGLADDAGESVIILRGAGFGNAPERTSPKFVALAQAGPVPGGGALETTPLEDQSGYSVEKVVHLRTFIRARALRAIGSK